MTTIAFKPHLRVEIVDSSTVYVFGEDERHTLNGRAYARVAALLLEAPVDDRAIAAALENEVRPAALQLAIATLRTRGLVAEPARDHRSGASAFRAMAGVDPHATERNLEDARIHVRALGTVDPRVMWSGLRDVFPRATCGNDAPEDGALQALVVDDYLTPELDDWNKEALRTATRWMLVKPSGGRIWMGPIFDPARGGCWDCLAFALRGHRIAPRVIDHGRPFHRGTPGVTPGLRSTEVLAAALLANELAKVFLASAYTRVDRDVVTVDTISLAIEAHRFARREACAACGDPSVRRPAPVDLRGLREAARETSGTLDVPQNGANTHDPDALLRQYAHLVSATTGIVGRLERMSPEGEALLHVYHATVAQPSPPDAAPPLRADENVSAGRGKTDTQARVSAFGEALERYSGMFQGHEARIRASARELGDDALHPDSLLLWSEAQIADRERWNRDHSHYHQVPSPLDPDERIEWCAVTSLTRGIARDRRAAATSEFTKWVPASYVYYNYFDPSSAYRCGADSNGSAAGGSMADAMFRGLLELVERDAVSIFWYNRIARPKIELSSFDDPYFRAVEARLDARGRDVWMLDLTSDLGIPVCAAVSAERDRAVEKIAIGFGADLDPEIAGMRAMTEVIQVMHSAEGPNRDLGAWRRHATRENQSYLVPHPSLSSHLFSRANRGMPPPATIARAIEHVVGILDRAGIEVFVIDQTRPEVGLPVVKVIAPGLRHFWARFGEGRLYDIPVKLGWLAKARTEAELNPIPFFL